MADDCENFDLSWARGRELQAGRVRRPPLDKLRETWTKHNCRFRVVRNKAGTP